MEKLRLGIIGLGQRGTKLINQVLMHVFIMIIIMESLPVTFERISRNHLVVLKSR